MLFFHILLSISVKRDIQLPELPSMTHFKVIGLKCPLQTFRCDDVSLRIQYWCINALFG